VHWIHSYFLDSLRRSPKSSRHSRGGYSSRSPLGSSLKNNSSAGASWPRSL